MRHPTRRPQCLHSDLPVQGLLRDRGGGWYGPDPSAGASEQQTCCQVQNGPDPTVTILAHDAWAVRDNQYKLVRRQIENCKSNQLELQYEFYAIDDAAPLPKLDREQDQPAHRLSPLEKPLNQEHVDSMQAFMGLGPRPFDLRLKAQTNALDLQIVMVNFGTVCESSGVCTSRQDGGRFFIPLPSGRRVGEGTSRVAWQRSPWVSPRKREQQPRLGGRICRNFPW
jgi:hypothetical protein